MSWKELEESFQRAGKIMEDEEIKEITLINPKRILIVVERINK